MGGLSGSVRPPTNRGGYRSRMLPWIGGMSGRGHPTPPTPPVVAHHPPEQALRWPDTERELREIIDLAMMVIDND